MTVNWYSTSLRLPTLDSHIAMVENVPVAVSAVCIASTNDGADGFPTSAMTFNCPTTLSVYEYSSHEDNIRTE